MTLFRSSEKDRTDAVDAIVSMRSGRDVCLTFSTSYDFALFTAHVSGEEHELRGYRRRHDGRQIFLSPSDVEMIEIIA